MKKFYTLICIPLSLFLLVSCSHQADETLGNESHDKNHSKVNENKLPDNPENNSEEDTQSNNTNHSSNQYESSDMGKNSTKGTSPKMVMQKIMQSINTSIPKLAPTQIPLNKDMFLTAAIKSDSNSFNIIFMQTSKPIAINHHTLNNVSMKNRISEFGAKKYKNPSQALASMNIPPTDLNKGNVDLGHGIKAISDAGAGHQYLSWNEGRWFINIDSPTDPQYANKNYPTAVELGKKIVSYLEDHMLPPPHDKGEIKISTWKNNNETKIQWQEQDIIYRLKTKREPIEALKMATSLESY